MADSIDPASPKRRAILAAASELFVARGYEAVSMDAIARAADVSKATLYAYFESKDQLFATIVQIACRENLMPESGLPAGDIDIDIEEALRAIGGRTLRFLLTPRSRAIFRLVLAESARFPELGRAFYENGPEAGGAGLGAWMARQPSLRPGEPKVAAEQFVGLLRTGLYMRAALGLVSEPAETEIDAVVAAAVKTFLAAYRARSFEAEGRTT